MSEKIKILEKKGAQMTKETPKLEKLDTVVKALIQKDLTSEMKLKESKLKKMTLKMRICLM